MNENKPLLSVALRAYNQENEIIRALNSVLEQNVSFDVELVIGVDVSTDNTLSMVRDYCKSLPGNFSYEILEHGERQGGTRNLISVLKACRGKYISILDGDDYWIDPEKSNRQIAVMEGDASIGLVYANYIIESRFLENGRKWQKHPAPQHNVFTQMLQGNFLGTNISTFRQELLGFVDFDLLLGKNWPQDDYFIWLEMANHAKFHHIDDFVAVYSVDRDVNSPSIPYDSCSYDKLTTEIREYYIRKYPQNTDLTVTDVWDNHYRYQLKSALIARDYDFAKDAIVNIHDKGGWREELYYRLISNKVIWKVYMLYRSRKKKSAIDKYFY